MKLFVLTLVILTSTVLPQNIGAGFLTLEPSPELHAMGGIGVGLPSQDLAAQYYNPANGIVQREGFNLAVARMKTTGLSDYFYEWPFFFTDDATFAYYNIGVGIKPSKWPIQFGLSLSRTRFDHDPPERTYVYGALLENVRSEKWADALQIAASGSIKIGSIPIVTSLGLSLKEVHQDIYSMHNSSTRFNDYGVIISAPIKWGAMYGAIKSTSLEIAPAIGYSLNNVGQEITFPGLEYSTVPGPRNVRIGISISSSITMSNGNELLSLRYGRAALDYLPIKLNPQDKRNGLPQEYQSRLGDIDFADHLIRGIEDENVTTQSGGEIVLGEIIALRSGEARSQTYPLAYPMPTERIEKSWGYTIYIDKILGYIGLYTGHAILNDIENKLTLTYTYGSNNNDNYYDRDYEFEREKYFDVDWDYSMITIGLKNFDGLFGK